MGTDDPTGGRASKDNRLVQNNPADGLPSANAAILISLKLLAASFKLFVFTTRNQANSWELMANSLYFQPLTPF